VLAKGHRLEAQASELAARKKKWERRCLRIASWHCFFRDGVWMSVSESVVMTPNLLVNLPSKQVLIV
jgi:hypothetical protein